MGIQKKPKADRSRSGHLSRSRGRHFEQTIALRMREIYDSPELLQELARLSSLRRFKEHRALLKSSRVRRSDQGRGAKEPDLVIQGCPTWNELQRAKKPTPEAKLRQAERDVLECGSDLLPVAVTSEFGSSVILAHMRASTYYALVGLLDEAFSRPEVVVLPTITIPFDDYLMLLRAWEEEALQ